MSKPLPLAALAAVLAGLSAPGVSAAQSVSPAEREALVRLRVDRGGRAEDVEALIRYADDAAAKDLPVEPLTNKIREGLAKGADSKRIESVIRQMVMHLETADRLIRELEPAGAGAGRGATVTLLAESFGSGVTPEEVRELGRQAGASGAPAPRDLAGAAKGLGFVKEASLPAAEGTAVMAEALRRGFRSHEILDLGREIKRREADYQAGRVSLRALRDAIARGDRPDQLFRDTRTDPDGRPAARRPEAVVDRPDRAPRPETPARPEQPERPDRPDRPERPERPEPVERPDGRRVR